MTDWDIVTGVGITALGAAAARAIESRRPDALVDDPYAAAFIHAADPPTPVPTTPAEADADPRFPWHRMATYTGVRSRFFDEFFRTAGEAGVRQSVIVAAGLDTRAFRLEWPPGATVYEVDAPLVLEFKDRVLRERDARPRCERRTVPSDLRGNWTTGLRQAGFDPSSPTAWLAEGLLPYLPDDVKDSLLTSIHELSASGSRVALEHSPDISTMGREPEIREAATRVDFDLVGLWPSEQRHDPAAWLAGNGWTVTIASVASVGSGYGRSLDDQMASMRSAVLITAAKD